MLHTTCYMLSLYSTSTGNIRRPSHKTAITPNDNGSSVLVFNNMKLWEHTIGVLLVSLSFLYSAWYLYKVRKIHLMSKSTRACHNLKAPSPPTQLPSIALPDWLVRPLCLPNSQVGSPNGQIGVCSIECKANPLEFSSVWAWWHINGKMWRVFQVCDKTVGYWWLEQRGRARQWMVGWR